MMRRRQRRTLARTIAHLALWAGLLGAAAVGSVRLDARYQRSRFTAVPTNLCPLAVSGSIVSPMCAAGPGW